MNDANDIKLEEMEKSQWGRIYSIFIVSNSLILLFLLGNRKLTNFERIYLISVGLLTFITCYIAYENNKKYYSLELI
ncbi:MAG: hypothetical protein KatS3mg096_600 [Candidatus Parcubacteria bacterium]|nr:MAG: hypothetical protein KatS3mg096_600 [Candidatus Parcubacteria bacterium]